MYARHGELIASIGDEVYSLFYTLLTFGLQLLFDNFCLKFTIFHLSSHLFSASSNDIKLADFFLFLPYFHIDSWKRRHFIIFYTSHNDRATILQKKKLQLIKPFYIIAVCYGNSMLWLKNKWFNQNKKFHHKRQVQILTELQYSIINRCDHLNVVWIVLALDVKL